MKKFTYYLIFIPFFIIYGWIMQSFTEIGIWGIIISAGFLGGVFSFLFRKYFKK
tara:strand:- start:35 stop:196 length:162 start_codon:yes stop_codon:yes gene_type:complete